MALRHTAACEELISPKYKNVTLHDSAAGDALVLDHTPIVVRLAVFLAWGLSQKHDPTNLAVEICAWE